MGYFSEGAMRNLEFQLSIIVDELEFGSGRPQQDIIYGRLNYLEFDQSAASTLTVMMTTTIDDYSNAAPLDQELAFQAMVTSFQIYFDQ